MQTKDRIHTAPDLVAVRFPVEEFHSSATPGFYCFVKPSRHERKQVGAEAVRLTVMIGTVLLMLHTIQQWRVGHCLPVFGNGE